MLRINILKLLGLSDNLIALITSDSYLFLLQDLGLEFISNLLVGFVGKCAL